MNCTASFINTQLPKSEACQYVKNSCPSDYINFYAFHYCLMNGSTIFTSIIMILFLIFLFFVLSSTSDIFLSTAITKIVETFNINQNVAAVTLLAFGNGAPDVISSLVASAEAEGIDFSISSLIGSGMFVTSFVLGSVVFRGKDIKVNSKMFNRDIILYFISLILVAIIGIKKKIGFFESFGFIIIYFSNIIIAVCQGRYNNNNDLNNDNKNQENKLGIIDENHDNKNNIEMTDKNIPLNDFYKEYGNVSVQQNSSLISQIFDEIKEDIIKEQEGFKNSKKNYSELMYENFIMARINLRKKYYFYKETDWEGTSICWKLFYLIIDFPLTFIREMTIPLADSNKKWNKLKFCFIPICDFIFISYVFHCK